MQDIFSVFIFGLEDALNPCKLASLALLGLLGSALCKTPIATRKLFVSFVITCVVATLVSRLGVYDELIMEDLVSYRLAIIVFYQMIGVAFLLFGAWLFYSWNCILRGERDVTLWGVFNGHSLLCKTLGIVLGFLAGTAATFWPRSQAVTMLTQKALFPGTLLEGSVMIVLHELLSFWPLVLFFVFFFFFLRGGKFADLVNSRRSLVAISMSAFYFSLGGTLVVLFFPNTPH